MKKCCIRTCVTFLVFAVLIATAVIVLLNMTPAKLHVADKSIAGTSFEENGLADVKFIKIFNGLRGLSKKEKSVVKNGYTATEAKTAAEEFFANSNYADASNYAALLQTSAEYNRHYMRVMADTTLAYILNDAVASLYEMTLSDGTATPALTVKEVTVNKSINADEQQVGNIRLVVGVPAQTFLGGIAGIVDKVKVIKLPEYVYLVFNATFTVGVDGTGRGKMIIGDVSGSIGGDENNALNAVLFNRIASAMGLEGDDGETAIGDMLFSKVTDVVGHIGFISQVKTSSPATGEVISEEMGIGGIEANKITFSVYKE